MPLCFYKNESLRGKGFLVLEKDNVIHFDENKSSCQPPQWIDMNEGDLQDQNNQAALESLSESTTFNKECASFIPS